MKHSDNPCKQSGALMERWSVVLNKDKFLFILASLKFKDLNGLYLA